MQWLKWCIWQNRNLYVIESDKTQQESQFFIAYTYIYIYIYTHIYVPIKSHIMTKHNFNYQWVIFEQCSGSFKTQLVWI